MATREELKQVFANGQMATGEKFANLIDSMKVVQLPVVDPQALGTSLTFIDSISQDADGKITATKKTLDLANAHELNPFKGWWKTGDTLPTSGFDGAYLYFKDTDQIPAVTTIYRWNGTTYAPTGTEVDESNVQTFATGQAVNGVAIKGENGEDVTGPADVLSAEAAMGFANRLLDEEVVFGKNLLYGEWAAGYYSSDGVLHSGAALYKYLKVPCKPNTTYCYSTTNERLGSSAVWVVLFGEDGELLANPGVEDCFRQKMIFTTPSDAYYVGVSALNTATDLQLEEGSDRTEYVEPVAPHTVVLIKENVLPPANIPDGSITTAKFVDNSITTAKLADGAVTEEKTVFFDVSPNLFNPDDPDVEQGYLNSSGTVSSHQSIRTSGWIPITPSTLYYFESSDRPLSSNKGRCVCFYLQNKTYIVNSIRTGVESATSPTNAYWMRVSYQNNNDDWDNGQITPLQKYPYSKFGTITLKEKYIPSITPEPVVESVPEVVFPSKIYALKGYENSVYFKNIADYVDPLYLFDGNGGIWDYYARCLRTQANNAGNINFSQKRVKDLSVVKTVTLTTNIGNPTTDNGNKNVNCIGDSFTYSGYWFDWINTCCPNLTFVGMRKSTFSAQTLRAEGRGGWKLSSYFQPYNDLTPTHMQPFSPFMHVSGYTYYGPVEFWKAIVTGTSQYTYGTNGFDDYVSWFDNNGYKVNPSVNDLMYDGTNDKYVYWNGSAWADFSGTPTFVFNYSKYISTWNIASPDFVMIMLGVNDWFGGYSDADAVTWNEQMNTVIQSIQAYATSVSKTIVIGICTNTTVIGMPNNNYKHSVELNSRGMFLGRKNTIQTFDNDTYRNQGVYVVDTGACLDPDYGFSVNEIKPFDYYEGTAKELYGYNGVHPSAAGYKQLGTCAAGFIQYIRGL